MDGKMLQDNNGNTSSKRVAGISMISTGASYLLAVGVVSIFKEVADPGTAIMVGKSLIMTGAALLGVGVFEGLKK